MNAELIDSQTQFDTFYSVLSSEPLLAVDTEFFRETTYFPKLGLVQVANSQIVANIDPLAFDAKDAIASLLLNPNITKVFHSCSQDLEVLNLYLGSLPCPVLDTQIAASLIDETEQIGYAKLVLQELDISLDKSQTRTNWLKRPLTNQQLVYAAEDVYYLFQIIEILSSKLKELNRKTWYQEDCDLLCASPDQYEPVTSNCGFRVKGTHKLPGLDLAIINQIANWREKLAIKNDKTRKRALPDDDVILVATNKPNTIEDFKRVGQISRYLNDTEQNALFEIVKASYLIPKNEWPDNRRKKLEPEEKNRLDSLHNSIRKKAAELNISSSVLCAKKELTALFYGNRESRVLTGWRLDTIGTELLRLLEA